MIMFRNKDEIYQRRNKISASSTMFHVQSNQTIVHNLAATIFWLNTNMKNVIADFFFQITAGVFFFQIKLKSLYSMLMQSIRVCIGINNFINK